MDAVLIKHLRFKWPDSKNALLTIDQLRLQKNSSLFLQGKSGSGKSTFLSLLAGIITPQSGSIELLENAFSDFNAKDRDMFRANHIGYIFQMFNLLPYLNVVENVMLPCFFSKQRANKIGKSEKDYADEARRLLNSVGLSDKTLLNKRPIELSLGQQQRIAACRALIGSPEILIADEPTSSLDAYAQSDFLHLLQEECSKNQITLIFVSHDDRLAQHFNQIAQLDNGNIQFLKSADSIEK
jgi:putative ABC transport system ATP-binding protein